MKGGAEPAPSRTPPKSGFAAGSLTVLSLPSLLQLATVPLSSDARELYESMVNEFHQSRTFFLEVMVVVILLIEIGFLLRGKG